ncbi:hypothetical protein Btru_062015 [Bulinus truncatus]|nr:hypothetical protein Btru_062015 [Bulinus truncatus]
MYSTTTRSKCLKREFAAIENGHFWREQVKYVKKNLLSAIDRGDHMTATNIIGSQIHTTTHSGRKIVNQAFIRACSSGNQHLASFLLSKGADVNFTMANGITPLKAAILSNSYPTVQLLIMNGASAVAVVNHKEDSPLHVALKRGFQPDPAIGSDKWNSGFLTDTNIIKLLIDSGAQLNQKCEDGYLPLSLAASANRDSVVSHLIENGADVNAVDRKYGMSPLMHAAIMGNEYVVQLLLKHEADMNISDIWGYTPLMLASQFRNHLVVSSLLQEGAQVNKVSEFDGKSSLILAAESRCCDTLKTLLFHGADVNYSKPFHKQGTTALMIAAKLDCIDTVDTLLKNGADVNMKDADGATALSFCTSHDIISLLKLPLQVQ